MNQYVSGNGGWCCQLMKICKSIEWWQNQAVDNVEQNGWLSYSTLVVVEKALWFGYSDMNKKHAKGTKVIFHLAPIIPRR